MTNYLTTDELLDHLSHQNQNSIRVVHQSIESKSTNKKRIQINRKIVFIVAVVIATLHIFYISIPLLSENRGINAFGTTTLLAVPRDQDLGDILIARVVFVDQFDPETLSIGDSVIIYGRYGSELNWVEEVVDIDTQQGIAQTTFDGIISNPVEISQIKGYFVGEADLIGIISFVSSSTRGYIFLFGTYVIVFTMVYFFYIRKKKDQSIQ